MTRILITSLNYAPEETGIAPYSTRVAEHLASQGYRVTVLAGLPHYPQWRVHNGYRRAGWRALLPRVERRNGVEVRRAWHHVPASRSVLRRGIYEATSLSMALHAARMPRPDAVLGVVPTLSGGIAARALAARFAVPYGLIIQDVGAPATAQSGGPGGALAGSIVRAGERWAMGGAAAVGIVAEGFRPYIESLGVEASRIRRLRNWTQLAAPTADRASTRSRLGWPDDSTVCLHAGNMGYKQGLENVIDCAVLAAAAQAPLLFVLMGDGNRRRELEALAAKYRLPNLRFLPLQDAAEYPNVLAAADVLLLNQRASVDDMSLPAKLTSYFAAARPIVAAAAAASETAREVSWSSGGIVVAPGDPKALLAGLLRVAGDPGLAAHLSRSGAAWAENVLSESQALRSYEQLLASVLASGRHGRVHSADRVIPMPHRETAAPESELERDRWVA